MTFTHAMETAVRGFELVGVALLVGGLVLAGVFAVTALSRGHSGQEAYQLTRRLLGGSILLSLEVLVAADLIRTVTIEPTLESVAVLGLIVLIRTILSFSIEVEIEGMLPWRRALLAGSVGAAAATDAARTAVSRAAPPH